MKIALPTRDGRIDDHFGHCHHYTIYTIDAKQIVNTEELPSPEGCGCKSGIAADLHIVIGHNGCDLTPQILAVFNDLLRTALTDQDIDEAAESTD